MEDELLSNEKQVISGKIIPFIRMLSFLFLFLLLLLIQYGFLNQIGFDFRVWTLFFKKRESFMSLFSQ